MLNATEHIEKLTERFPHIYRGQVMDVDDPETTGRIKVRVEPMFKNIETDLLPWAVPGENLMIGADGASVDIGCRWVPDKDSWVFVFFEGGDPYCPVYVAAAPSHGDGPTLTYETDDTVTDRTARLSTQVPVGSVLALTSGTAWDEPSPAHAAEYPANRVIKTKAGHVIEIDDTEGEERIHIYHKSGTNVEIRSDGSMTEHVVGDKVTVIEGNHFIHVKGDQTLTVGGNRETWVGINNYLTVIGNRLTSIGINDVYRCVGNLWRTVTLGIFEFANIKRSDVTTHRVHNTILKAAYNTGGDTYIQSSGGNVEINKPVDINTVVPPTVEVAPPGTVTPPPASSGG